MISSNTYPAYEAKLNLHDSFDIENSCCHQIAKKITLCPKPQLQLSDNKVKYLA